MDDVLDQLRQLAMPGVDIDHNAHMHVTGLVAQLKAFNRSANAARTAARQKTDSARHEMDQSHLGLQNLLYEKRHLEREIQKCRQFGSIYQDVPLHPLEEFYILAPDEARTPEVLSSEHQLMLNRLSFELAERDRLEKLRKSLASEKDKLLQASKTKAVTMDQVKTQIDNLMKNASDIQRKVDELVETLPPPSTEQQSS